MLFKLSIIICTYNRASYLIENLRQLISEYNERTDIEVLIINNNSSDNTGFLVEGLLKVHQSTNFRCINEHNQGLSFARNRGIKEAKGEILTFIDDDAYPSAGFSDIIIDYFKRYNDVQAIGGLVKPRYEVSEPRWMTKYLLGLIAVNIHETKGAYSNGKFPMGANMSFRAGVFLDPGYLFNENLGRKGELLLAAEEKEVFGKMNNEQIHFVPEASVEHIIPASRTTQAYIKKQGLGLGISERVRLKNSGLTSQVRKALIEVVKMSGTLLLSAYFLARFEKEKALMLLKFRYWVWQGLFSLNIDH